MRVLDELQTDEQFWSRWSGFSKGVAAVQEQREWQQHV